MANLEDMVEIAYPQQPHCPTVLLLDTSGSMTLEGKIAQLQEGVALFREEIGNDELARKRVDLAVITFGDSVDVVSPFSSVEEFEVPALEAKGLTPMGAAINTAIDLVERRKKDYRTEGIDYYRPWIFMITDGEPTDMYEGDATWNKVVENLHDGEKEGKFLFFTVGVEPADMLTLKKIAPQNRGPVKLRENNFREMFIWLSRSQAKVSASSVGDQVVLEDPLGPEGWAEIPTY